MLSKLINFFNKKEPETHFEKGPNGKLFDHLCYILEENSIYSLVSKDGDSKLIFRCNKQKLSVETNRDNLLVTIGFYKCVDDNGLHVYHEGIIYYNSKDYDVIFADEMDILYFYSQIKVGSQYQNRCINLLKE